MIESWGDEATRDVFLAKSTRQARSLPHQLWPVIRRKLTILNGAARIMDLQIPPGNRLEPLKGDHEGTWSIRVNDQYRITFRSEGGDASAVCCEDYH